MLKIVAIGNLTNDVELKVHEATGKPYAILRIASDRRYRDKEGNRLTDFISIKVGSPASSSKPRRWSSCLPAAWRKAPCPCLRTVWMRLRPERHAEYRH